MSTTALATRGTSNSNARGSTASRKARREWLVETYRANMDMSVAKPGVVERVERLAPTGLRLNLSEDTIVVPACRCYRCGTLLTVETVTVDRIIPGCQGGTYRRSNIWPACGSCNSETGGKLAHRKRR